MKFSGFQRHHVILTGDAASHWVRRPGGRIFIWLFFVWILVWIFANKKLAYEESEISTKLWQDDCVKRFLGWFLWRSASSVSSKLISFNCFQLHSWLLMSAVRIYMPKATPNFSWMYLYTANGNSMWENVRLQLVLPISLHFGYPLWFNPWVCSSRCSRILFSFLASKNINFRRFAKVSCQTDSFEGPVWSFWSATRLLSRRMDEFFRRICLFNHGINYVCQPSLPVIIVW